MNRNDWEKQVYASDLSPTARLVALVLGSFGNWTEDQPVWPGTAKVAEKAGLSRDTTQDYIDALEDQGWIKENGKVKRSTRFVLCEVVAEPTGILLKGKKAMSPNSLAQLKRGKDTPIAEPTGSSVAETIGSLVAEPSGAIADGFGTILNKEHKEENLPMNLPVSDEAQLSVEETSDVLILPNSESHGTWHKPKTAYKLSSDDLMVLASMADGFDIPRETVDEAIGKLETIKANGTPFRNRAQTTFKELGVYVD